MSKLRSTQTLSSTKNKKAANNFTPKEDKPKKKRRPKVSRVIIVARPIIDGSGDSTIMNTQIIADDLPDGILQFGLVVVLSPNDDQPVQYPPFERSFSLISTPGNKAGVLAGPPLNFANDAEPSYGTGEYVVSLIQDVTTGEVWDVSEAEVDVVYGAASQHNNAGAVSPATAMIPQDDKRRPKVSRVVIIKKPINGDPSDSVKAEVHIDATDLPTNTFSFALDINLTANTGQPTQVAPNTESFVLDDNLLKGYLNFSSNDFITDQSNPYTIGLVENTDDSKDWDISSATCVIHEE
ncbi:MAG: hypothetical protein AAGG75_03850 [Bacteroidota bacterium]